MSPLRVGSIVVTVVVAIVLAWVAADRDGEPPAAPPRTTDPTPAPRPREPSPPLHTDLPREATDTLARIQAGGPFRYRQDGGVFGNYEARLPKRARGYYREYTVETPGSRDRGARRIVTGGNPPVEFFYTDDHYRSFRPIEGPR